MKKPLDLIAVFLLLSFISCHHEVYTVTDNYASVDDFFTKNAPPIQTYTINAATGGSFTSPQGTVVTIPPNAFVSQSNLPVTGNVTIQFLDIYKKSDMLLANMPTQTYYGAPLKSGGEFFIKALSGNTAVDLAQGQKISVSQPTALTGRIDSTNSQKPWVLFKDSIGGMRGWGPVTADTISVNTITYPPQNYIFSLYQFCSPVDSGSWCNNDNYTYFSAYNMTNLTIHANDSISEYNTSVFLLFSDLSSMVSFDGYSYFNADFIDNYAPVGLKCTLVAVGVKNGTLYSSFVPITITANDSVSFSLSKTNTLQFKSQLNALY